MKTRPLAALLLLAPLLLAGCPEKKPLKIGFLGGLTGRLSGLGTAGRNGVILAVEEINRHGGIDGHPVELVTRDDRQDRSIAIQGLRELHQEGAVAVIGPMTSAMAVETVPEADRLKLLTIGPTISTNDLSGKDDYFFRIRPASRYLAESLAQHLIQETPVRRLSIVYDLNNRAHTVSWHEHIKSSFEALGGKVVAVETFVSSEDNRFSEIARNLLATPTDAILLLAGGLDTALLCQQLHKLGARLPLFASEWSFTDDLLQFGGVPVEGLTVIHTYNPQDQRPRFAAFHRAFKERFGEEPGFAAAHSYDAARLLFAALQRNHDPAQLKQTLAGLTVFEGVQTTLRFDRFGDVERELFLTRVKNGRFVPLEH